MTLTLQVPEVADLRPRITVFGVGGAGCNAVNNMIEKSLEGVDFVVANTDAQALQGSKAGSKIQLGEKATEGLGAGAQPQVGAAAAEESIETIVDHLAGSHMCFITAGMGGGTGTGAAPIIAQAARELGVLTVGVVTKPFQFEGAKRMRQANEGIEELQKVVDTLIIIPNQNLFIIANEKTTFTEAFELADDVLYQGVKGVTDLMVRPGLINLDFADIRVVMDEMGKAMMGTGEATGETRAIDAAEKAIANPLLDEISLEGARGVLINITGGNDLTLFEVDEAANRIRDKVDEDANIIVGSTLDSSMDGVMRVSVVATGIDASILQREEPRPIRRTLKSPLPLETAPAEEPVAPAIAAETSIADVSEEPMSEPMQHVASREAEPMLESSFETAEPVAQEPDLFGHPEPEISHADDLPPPAYQAAAEVSNLAEIEDAPEFIAQNEAVSEPTDAVRARLMAAVEKQPPKEPLRVQESPRSIAPEPEKKSGFGLGGLISRMTGQAQPEEPLFTSQRQEPEAPKYASEYEQMDAEDETAEIPAFLRRQAN